MNKNIKILLVVGTVMSFMAIAAFAAVRLSVSKQKVKTLRATLTYQDIITAPQPDGDPNRRLLKIWDIPADTEIISAYIKVLVPFEHPDPNDPGVSAYLTDNRTTSITNGVDLGAISVVIDHGRSLMFPVADELRISIDGLGWNLNDLISGSMQIYVNYLEHGN